MAAAPMVSAPSTVFAPVAVFAPSTVLAPVAIIRCGDGERCDKCDSSKDCGNQHLMGQRTLPQCALMYEQPIQLPRRHQAEKVG
jgi:hypothetical protein